MFTRFGNWLWVSLYAFCLILLLTPLSPFALLFIMVPLVVLFSRYAFLQTVAPFLVILLLYSLLNRSIGLLMFLVTLFFLLPALLMGRYNRQNKHAGIVIFSGFAAMLAQIIAILVITFGIYNINLIQLMSDQLRSILQTGSTFYSSFLTGIDYRQQIESFIELFNVLFPSLILLISIFYAWISYMLARWLLATQKVQLPPYMPVRDWRLPRSLIWYNVVVIVISLIVDDKTSFLYTMHMNLFILLLLLFWVQGIGFLYFWTYHKKWNETLPIIGVVLSIFSPILYIFSLLGLVDMLFPLRKRISGQS